MTTRATRRAMGVMVAGVVAAAGLACVPAAQAQEVRVRSTMGDGVGGGASQVTRKSLDRYSELLGFTKEQADLAATIHEGYAAAFNQARKARTDGMTDARRAAEDADDHQEFMKRFGAIQKDYRDAATKLEKDFFRDLQGILTPQQEPQWATVERHRRREVGLRSETLSGAGVDIGEVVRNLKLAAEALAAVNPALDQYELDLDRQLQTNAKLREESQGAMPMGGGAMEFDAQKMQTQMEAAREAGAKVQEINDRHSRAVEGLLPEGAREKFRDEMQRRSFPRVYRASRVAKDLDAALKLPDLTSDQRERLESLKAAYERDLAPANQAWANAIRDKEKAGDGGAVAIPGGGIMMLDMGEDPESLTAARKARREIDDKASDRLKSTLTPDQRAKLPKPAPDEAEEGGPAVSGQMIFHTIDDRR